MSNSPAVTPTKALVVMVSEDGQVENRIIDTPIGLPSSALVEASNYLNARLRGRTLDAARSEILEELVGERAELDVLTAKIVADGLATLSTGGDARHTLIVRGTSHLLDTVEAQTDIERVRTLFEDIERKNDLIEAVSSWPSRATACASSSGSENRAVQPVRLVHRGRALCQFPRQDRRRDRRSGPHPPQLWPHHPDGRPYRQSRWPADCLTIFG